MRLAKFLVEMGLVERSLIDSLLADNPEHTPRSLGELLLSEGAVSAENLMRATGRVFALDFLPKITDNLLDPQLVEKLPIAWAREHCVLPVRCQGELSMLTADPETADEEAYLSLLLREEIVPLLCPREEILRGIERCYVSKDAGGDQLIKDLETDADSSKMESSTSGTDLLSVVEGAPVTQFVNFMLLEAVKANASDIHIEPCENHIQIRYRIDGTLYEQSAPPKRLQDALVSRLKVMARLDIAEKRLPQDGMAKVRVGEREIDVRVSSVPVTEGERLVLRILSRQSALMPLSDLGMSENLLEVFGELLREPQGIILVTGPTGSGKTTSLYAGLQRLDTQHANVITIEDPVEYQLQGISQIQVKPRIGLTFAGGLRHILRQDPDVILIGEIRDTETAEIAIRSSLTGHLVLSTLHTNDAASTPMRIIDMGIKPYLLSESLRAVIAQRLVRKLCSSCKIESDWTDDELRQTGMTASTKHYRASGCDACRDGYTGRIGLFEYLLVNDEVKDAIRVEQELRILHELTAKYSMDTLWNDGMRKVRNGVTSLSEVRRVLGGGQAEREL